MVVVWRNSGLARRSAGIALCAVTALAAGCDRDDTGPTDPAGLAITYEFTPAALATSAGAQGAFDKTNALSLRITDGSETRAQSVVAFQPKDPEVRVPTQVRLKAFRETLRLELEVRLGPNAVFRGSTTAALRVGRITEVVVPITPVVAAIVGPDSTLLTAWGDTATLRGAAVFVTGDTIPGIPITWSTLDPGIASVTSDGTVVSKTDGLARVIARAGAFADTVPVRVLATVASITISPPNVVIPIGGVQQFTAVLKDRRGNIITGRPLIWTSSNPSVVTIDPNGLAHGIGTGPVKITAMVGTTSGDAAANGAAGAPTTGQLDVQATGPGNAEATVNVTPNGGATTVSFQWSQSPTFSNPAVTPTQSIGSGGSPITVKAPIQGLVSGTTYYVRVVATNGSGTTTSPAFMFRMPVFPADVSTAGSIGFNTGNSILQGQVNPNGAPTEVWFQWGTDPTLQVNDTTAHQTVSGLQPIGFAAIIGPLLPGTTYYYRAVSRNEAGTTFGQILSFTTPSTIVLPGAPAVTTGSAVGTTKSSTTLSGSVTPNGANATAWFEWGTTPTLTTPFSTPAQIIGSGTAAVPFNAPLGSLSANTTYWFRMVASNGGGTSRGAIASFTTLPDPALSAPSASTAGATLVTTTGATVNGSANPNGVLTVTWFEWATNPTLTSAVTTPALPIGSGTSVVPLGSAINGLTPGTTYWFRTVATSAGGTSRGAILSFTTTANPAGSPPTAVTGVASMLTTGTAQLAGSANPHGQSTSGWFEWGTDPLLGSFTATAQQSLGSGTVAASYTASVGALAANTTYWFRAAASNADGTGRGAIVSFKTLPDPGVTPPVATTTAATAVGPSSATLNGTGNPNGAQSTAWFEWSTSPLLTSPSITASQSLGAGVTAVPAAMPLTGLSPGTTYYYRIVVASAGGTRTGAIVPFTTTSTPVTGAPIVVTASASNVNYTTVTLNGTANPNGSATNAWFEWGTDSSLTTSSSTAPQAIGSGTSALAFPADLTGLTPEATYYFRIVASNASGTSLGAILSFRAVK